MCGGGGGAFIYDVGSSVVGDMSVTSESGLINDCNKQ